MARMSSKDGVIDLTAYRRGAAADCFSEVETYWQTLCAGRIMPDRDDVDPRGMAGALPNVFLVERIAPSLARVRLAGQHLSDVIGMDLRGMPVGAMFSPQGRKRVAGALQAVFDEPARVEMALDGGRGLLRRPLTGRMLLLPLRDKDGTVSRALGCFKVCGSAIRLPQTFDVTQETRRTLVGYAALPAAPAAPVAEPAAAETPRRAALRLVASN